MNTKGVLRVIQATATVHASIVLECIFPGWRVRECPRDILFAVEEELQIRGRDLVGDDPVVENVEHLDRCPRERHLQPTPIGIADAVRSVMPCPTLRLRCVWTNGTCVAAHTLGPTVCGEVGDASTRCRVSRLVINEVIDGRYCGEGSRKDERIREDVRNGCKHTQNVKESKTRRPRARERGCEMPVAK